MKKLIVICGFVLALVMSAGSVFAATQADYDALKKEYEGLVTTAETLTGDLTNLNTNSVSLQSQLKSYEGVLDSQNDTLQSEKDKMETYQKNGTTITSTMRADYDMRVATITDAINEAQSQIDNLENNLIPQNNASIEAKKTELEGALQQVATKQSELQEMEKEIEKEETEAIPSGLHLNPDALGTDSSYLIKTDSTLTTETNIVAFLEKIMNAVLYLVAAVAVLVIIFEALKLVAGAGNEDKLTEAKHAITWVAIALVVIMLSYAIVKTILTAIFTIAT